MKSWAALWSGMVVGLLALTPCGCGGRGYKLPEMGKVKGTLTYKGAPVKDGTVSFFPIEKTEENGGRPAIGEIGSDGSFELTTFDTGDGAVLGQHKVVVVVKTEGGLKIPEGTIPSQLPEDLKKYEPPKPPIPVKYMDAEKTPLRYTVRPGENRFEITLKD